MSFVVPILDPRIAAIAPGFRALSISVEATPIVDPQFATHALAQA